jgi:hypothetical protein
LYRDGKNCAVLRSLRLVPGSNKKAKSTAPASVLYVTLTNHTACRYKQSFRIRDSLTQYKIQMKKTLISGFFLITCLIINAQRDTYYFYTYKGKITFKQEVNFDSIILKLPNSLHLSNPKFRSKASYYYKLHYLETKLQPGGTFCKKDTILYPPLTNPSLYLHSQFIDKPKNYKILISEGETDKVILIDLTEIIFTIKGYEIIIEFPEIVV